jgi:hypothetical protein
MVKETAVYNPDAEVTIKLRELKELLDEYTVEDDESGDLSIPEDKVSDIMEHVYNRSLIAECLKRR